MGNSYSVYFYSTNKWENRGDELNIQQLEVTLQSLISPYFELTQLIKVIHTKQQQIIDDTGVGENQTRKTQV